MGTQGLLRFQQPLTAQQCLEQILQYASQRGCSDIHLEPVQDRLRIRLRCDGVLVTAGTLPKDYLETLTARVKIMANLDIANKRLPQDGRFAWQGKEGPLDVRVSTMPTIRGEKTVIRLLDQSKLDFRLASLGMDTEVLGLVRSIIRSPSGLWLAAGPTGSGKTSTVYAAIQEIAADSIHIATLEDPVEYAIDGISQSQIQPKQGLYFQNGLRALLRQDPDVLVIGEIRDAETAQIAVRAALTGHVVFSTIHTATAVEVPLRLMDMGIPPYLLADALQGITAQRLARQCCTCRRQEAAQRGERGCPQCFYSGYRRRFCLCEVVPVKQQMKQAIRERAPSDQVALAARADGAVFFADVAARAVAQGLTDWAEIQRIYAE